MVSRRDTPLSNLLKSAAGTCRFCGQKAGVLSRDHPGCHRTIDTGFQEMVNLATEAARTHTFDEKTLRLSLAEIARRSYGDGTTVNQALEEGWKRGVTHSMADGILTQQEETLLRQFRDRIALDSESIDRKAAAELERASADRLMLDARLAAIATEDPGAHLHELTDSLRQSGMTKGQQTALLVRAWEAAVEGTLEDGLLTRDEENALARYMDHFNLTPEQLDRNGASTTLVQAAVIRDITEGIVPQRQNITGRIPFNLMKSETLVCGSWTGSTTWRSSPGGSAGEAPTGSASGWLGASTTGPAPSGAGASSGRRPSTRTPASSGSPPSTCTSRDRRRNSGSGTTG